VGFWFVLEEGAKEDFIERLLLFAVKLLGCSNGFLVVFKSEVELGRLMWEASSCTMPLLELKLREVVVVASGRDMPANLNGRAVKARSGGWH